PAPRRHDALMAAGHVLAVVLGEHAALGVPQELLLAVPAAQGSAARGRRRPRAVAVLGPARQLGVDPDVHRIEQVGRATQRQVREHDVGERSEGPVVHLLLHFDAQGLVRLGRQTRGAARLVAEAGDEILLGNGAGIEEAALGQCGALGDHRGGRPLRARWSPIALQRVLRARGHALVHGPGVHDHLVGADPQPGPHHVLEARAEGELERRRSRDEVVAEEAIVRGREPNAVVARLARREGRGLRLGDTGEEQPAESDEEGAHQCRLSKRRAACDGGSAAYTMVSSTATATGRCRLGEPCGLPVFTTWVNWADPPWSAYRKTRAVARSTTKMLPSSSTVTATGSWKRVPLCVPSNW